MDDFIAIFAIFCVIALPIIAVIILIIRLTASDKKERMEMIKRGMLPPEKTEVKPSRLRTLRSGMGAVGAGIGFILSIIVLENVYPTTYELYQLLVVVGCTMFFFGLAFVIYYVISKNEIETED